MDNVNFNSDGSVAICRTINIANDLRVENVQDYFELTSCVDWITKHNYSKVCLQFPDCLLVYSVDIALFIEKKIGSKVFILGDTSYGSCCVDEVATAHINGDAIIHFGHACLSPVSELPVLYIFPKFNDIDLEKLKQCMENMQLQGNILLLYDVEYSHLIDTIKEIAPKHLREKLIISELSTSLTSIRHCCTKCKLTGKEYHEFTRLNRNFCINDDDFENILYLGVEESKNLENFQMFYKEKKYYFYDCSNQNIKEISITKNLKKLSFFVEKVKDSNTIGILAATLVIKGHLEAINYVKKLCKRRGKRSYVLSVGKPSVAKLANFEEIDIFVAIGCPEMDFGDLKEFYRPIVSLLEIDLALNEARKWESRWSKDFRDFIPGGFLHVDFPENSPINEPEVSLLTNNLQTTNTCGVDEISTSSSLLLRSNMAIVERNKSLKDRSWQGLDPTVDDAAPADIVEGRRGIAASYINENEH